MYTNYIFVAYSKKKKKQVDEIKCIVQEINNGISVWFNIWSVREEIKRILSYIINV